MVSTILVTSSRSPEGATGRIASTIAAPLHASVIPAELATGDVLVHADRIGFGSWVYWLGFDAPLVQRIKDLPAMPGKDAFVFATSVLPEPLLRRYLYRLRALLEDKEFRVIGMFSCRGVAVSRGLFTAAVQDRIEHESADLVAARAFATRIAP